MLDYNNSRPHPATSSPSPPSTPHEAVEASLSLAQTYIAQGNTTAALQTVFETLRTFCGDTAAQSAAARVESQLLHLHLQPQQPSAQSAISQLADIMNGCRIYNDQPVQPCSSQQIPLEAGMQQLHMQTQPSQYSNSHQPLLTVRSPSPRCDCVKRTAAYELGPSQCGPQPHISCQELSWVPLNHSAGAPWHAFS
ncbi:hypothetical protein ABBQ32_003780 [Trebouxia sp. C0010 RCD-2024]